MTQGEDKTNYALLLGVLAIMVVLNVVGIYWPQIRAEFAEAKTSTTLVR